MATDNAVLPAAGANISADDVSGTGTPLLVQRVKPQWGADGTGNDVDIAAGQGLPIQSIDLGYKADSVATSDTGTFSFVALMKRLLGKFPAALGSAVSASSFPVVIASDQPALATAQTVAAASGTITTQNLNLLTGTPTANSFVSVTLNGAATVTFQITGTYTGTLVPQITLDGATWVTMSGVGVMFSPTGSFFSSALATAAVGILQLDVAGALAFRLSASSAVTGSAVVTMRGANGAASVAINSPLVTSSAQIGTVQIAGSATIALNAGANTIGRVNQAAVATANGANLYKIASLASTNAVFVKTGVGNVFQMQVTNTAAYAVCLQFYNSATTFTVGTTTEMFKVVVPAGGAITVPHGPGIFFSTGIGMAITKLDNSAVAANDLVGHLLFA